MSFDGAEFTFAQRQRAIRELERLRREGVIAANDVLQIVNDKNIDAVWPYVALMLDFLLAAQQRAARDTMMSYMAAVGVGVGLGVATVPLLVPDASLARNGRLPSGMPWQRLTGTGLQATAHRIENGMSVPEAVQYLKVQMVAAVADQAHDEARKVATDILQGQQDGADWARLDREYDAKVAAARARADDAEVRRLRRNKSAKQKAMMGWQNAAPPGVTRYIRVPSPGACPFCLLLATRGAVYYRDSWNASKSFRKNGEAKAHAHCRCTVMPEPEPGAFRGVIIGNAEDYASAIWRSKKFNREYDLAAFVRGKQLLTAGEVEQMRYVLAA